MNDPKTRPQFISVPFKAESPNGITEYNGIAKFSPAGIVIEFKSVIIGLIPGEVKEVQVPINEILDIKFNKGIYKFFSKIQLRLLNFATISRLPNSDGKIKLKIKREDFEIAQKAVEQMLRYINSGEAAVLPGTDDINSQLPPAQVSVNELFDTEKLEPTDPKKTKELDNFTR
jgi:hypothetical protein